MKTTPKKKALGNIGVALLIIWFAVMMTTEYKLDYAHPQIGSMAATWGFIASLTIALPGLVLTYTYKLRPAANR